MHCIGNCICICEGKSYRVIWHIMMILCVHCSGHARCQIREAWIWSEPDDKIWHCILFVFVILVFVFLTVWISFCMCFCIWVMYRHWMENSLRQEIVLFRVEIVQVWRWGLVRRGTLLTRGRSSIRTSRMTLVDHHRCCGEVLNGMVFNNDIMTLFQISQTLKIINL